MRKRFAAVLPQPGSFFQRPREAEKRDPGNEVDFHLISVKFILFNSPWIKNVTKKYMLKDEKLLATLILEYL